MNSRELTSRLFPFVFACLLVTFTCSGQEVNITKDSHGYVIHYSAHAPTYSVTENGDSIPHWPNTTFIYEKGKPELPKFSQTINLIDEEIVGYEIISDEYIDIEAAIAPSQGFLHSNERHQERVKGPSYSTPGFYPKSTLFIFDIHQIKGDLKQTLWLYAIQFDELNHKLRIHQSLKIRLITKKTNPNHSSQTHQRTGNDDARHMVIIAPDSLLQSMDDFILWKRQIGITPHLIAVDSINSSESIKQTIKNYYENDRCDYALLVGRHNQVPANATSYGLSDYSYGLVDGNDQYAEVPVGRFPAHNTKRLRAVTSKTIQYEKGLQSGDWQTHILGVASDEGDSIIGDKGESDYEHIEGITALFENEGYSRDLFHENASSNPSISQVLNNGCGYIFYAGHGTEKNWSSVDYERDSLTALKNTQAHPFIVTAACINGNIAVNGNLAEEFMCRTHEDKPVGAIAMLASSIYQLWAPPMLGQDEITERIINPESKHHALTMGDINLESHYEVMNQYGSGGIETVYTWMLFGDPTLQLWNNQPLEITASFADEFNVAKDTFEVQGPDSAFVTLMMGQIVLDQGFVTNGFIKLTKGNVQINDSLTLTISKPFHKPLEAKISPYSDGSSYYFVNELTHSDDNNDIAENSEWIEIQPHISNIGSLVGHELVVTLLTYDNDLESSEDTIRLTSIDIGETIIASSFKIRTLNPIPDGQTVKIGIQVKDSTGLINTNTFNIVINAPVVHAPVVSINNETLNESIVVQSDTVQVDVLIRNSGHAESDTIRFNLTLEDWLIQPISEFTYTTTIPAKDSAIVSFLAVIDSNCIPGYSFNGLIDVDDFSPLPFSFSYKTIPILTVGDGSKISKEFPFYNYYKSNKSQFIFTSEELGGVKKTIDRIGLNIEYVPFNDSHHNIENLSIKVGHTGLDEFGSNYETLDSFEVVYSASTYQLPDTVGRFFIDIADFDYNGHDNMMIEIGWGQNAYTTSFSTSFKMFASQYSKNLTTYGFSDQAGEPTWIGLSKIRPDMTFEEIVPSLKSLAVSYQIETEDLELDSVRLAIGTASIWLYTGEETNLQLPSGVYAYMLDHPSIDTTLAVSTFTISEDSELVIPIGQHATAIKEQEHAQPHIFIENDILHISHDTNLEFIVSDLGGKIHLADHGKSAKNDISGLSSGIYILKITTSEGQLAYRFFR